MDAISSKEFTDLELGICSGFVKTFPTKSKALGEASAFGWSGKVVRVARRFETVWIVGRIDFQPETAGSLEWDVLRIPALYYEDKGGVKTQPVLKCRRLRKEAAA